MTVSSIISQLVQQVQFLGLLSGLSIELPDVFRKFINFLNVANLDFQTLLGRHNLPAITFRRTFMGVSLVFPLIITLALVLLFQPAYIVAWYSTILAGSLLLCFGVIATLLPSRETELTLSTYPPSSAMILGGSMLFVALLAGVIFWVVRKVFGGPEDAVVDQVKRQSWLLRFHRSRTLRHFLLFSGLFVGGFVLSGLVPIAVSGGFTSQNWLSHDTFKVIGFVLVGASVVVLFYAVCHLFRPSRQVMNIVTGFLGANMLLILTVAVTSSYTPVIEYATNVFLCTSYKCPAGSVFNPFAERAQGSFDTEAATFCDSCDFNETLQPQCTADFAAQHCPAYSSVNAWRYPSASCRDETFIYFAIAAAAVLGIYIAAIPVLFLVVVRKVSADVLGAVIVDRGPTESYDSIWMRKMAAVAPVVASLYEPFNYPRRYFQVVQLLYRLAVTLVVNILGPFTQLAPIFLLVTHCGMGAFLLFFRPYISSMGRILSVTLAACNAIDCVFAIVIWQKGRNAIPVGVSYFIIFLNVVAPVAIGAVAGVVAFRRRRVNRAAAAEAEEQYDEEEARRQRGGEKDEVAADKEQELREEIHSGAVAVAPERHLDTSYFGDHTDTAMEFAGRGVSKEVRARYNDMVTVAANTQAERQLSRTFMVVGVVLLVGLGVATLGTMREPAIPYRQGSSALYRTNATVLGGYDSWANFTDNCCCVQQTTPSEDWARAERWVCRNGNVVERGRVTSKDSGLFLRGFCASTFRAGCTAAVQSSRVSFSCTDYEEIVPLNVSALAYKILW